MLESLIYFSPATVLLIALLVLMFGERDEEDVYGCFRFSRIMLLLSFVLAVIFYNKTTVVGLTVGNKFTLLFDCMLYGAAMALFYPSRKWFISMNLPAHIFCGCLFLTVLSGSLLISSANFALTAGCCATLLISNYVLLKQNIGKKEIDFGNKLYLFTAIIGMILLAVSAVIFYEKSGSLMYMNLRTALEIGKNDLWLFAAVGMTVAVFILLLGLAPLHFCSTEILGGTTLPVFVYFLCVPLSAVWGGFIQLNVNVLEPVLGQLRLFYMGVALLSVGIGAIGACSGQNIRKIFAYGMVFHLGIVLLTLRKFTLNAVNSGFIYLFVYLLTMYGICVCLFGLKKKGEYLFMLSEFEGAAQKRPYISAMLLIFMFSLLGLPPFLGFFGVFSALSYLAEHDSFYQFGYIMLMLIVLSYAYVQIIKNLYFEKSKENFDRADSGIYTAVLINALLMIVIMLKPQYLLQDVYKMIESLFL